jgi:hypothetical protein
MTPPDPDFGDDIVQGETPRHLPAPGASRSDFKPWHRVRKQFIREKQWNHEIHHLVKRLRRTLQTEETEWGASPTGEGVTADSVPEELRIERPLRCLLLPGDEMLDVRCLWQRLQIEGCYMRFLGFNNALNNQEQRRQMAVTESAITQLDKICKESVVTPDSFQDIGHNNSQAYSLFRRYGPYDVVNLDLCDSLVPRGQADETTANFSALHQILHFQIQHQKTPWLLFATTQVDRSTADQPEINRLAGPTRNNCDRHAEFAAALGTLIPEATFRSTAHAFELSYLDANHLVRVFGVVLGKWLVGILSLASPRCAVKLLTSYRYVIRQDIGIEILSLGFLITPHYAPPVDQTGLSNLQPAAKPFPTELETGLAIVHAANGIRDVDALLAEDQATREKLRDSKADLLAAAGFDRDAYLKWVAEGEHETN